MLAVVEAVSLPRSVSLTGKRNRDGHGKEGEGMAVKVKWWAIPSRLGATGGRGPEGSSTLPKNRGENRIAEGRRRRDEKEGTYERGAVPAQVRRDR